MIRTRNAIGTMHVSERFGVHRGTSGRRRIASLHRSPTFRSAIERHRSDGCGWCVRSEEGCSAPRGFMVACRGHESVVCDAASFGESDQPASSHRWDVAGHAKDRELEVTAHHSEAIEAT